MERFPDVRDILRIKFFVLYIYEKQGFSSNRKAINLMRRATMKKKFFRQFTKILESVYVHKE